MGPASAFLAFRSANLGYNCEMCKFWVIFFVFFFVCAESNSKCKNWWKCLTLYFFEVQRSGVSVWILVRRSVFLCEVSICEFVLRCYGNGGFDVY